MLALMDSFYLPRQKEMPLNTKGTGTPVSGLHSVLQLIVCVMWCNNCLLSKMKHLNVLPLDRVLLRKEAKSQWPVVEMLLIYKCRSVAGIY